MTVRRCLLPVLLTAVVLLAAVVLAGCGTAEGRDPAAGPGTRASPGASDRPDTPPTPSASAPPAPADPTLPSAAADETWEPWSTASAASDLTGATDAGFTAADDAIGCGFTRSVRGAEVRCDRAEGLGVDQPRPPGCDGAWGDAVVASARDGGRLVCGGRSLPDVEGVTGGGRRLADGEAVTYEGLTCAVRDASIQCLSPDRSTGGRGFVVSTRVLVVR